MASKFFTLAVFVKLPPPVGTCAGMRPFVVTALLFTACFSPIPEAQTSLVPVTVERVSTDAGVDAGVRVPAAPITAVVDALMANPRAATSEDEPFVSSCRGDDFLKNVARPPGCTGSCLCTVGSDRSAVVLDDSAEGFSVIGADARRVAWVRQSRGTRSVMVSDLSGAPRQLVTNLPSSAFVVFDGDDALVVETIAGGQRGNTRIVRYPAGQPESMRRVVLEARGQVLDERRVAVDAAGRVWAATNDGLWRSSARGEAGTGAEVPLVNGPNGGRVNAFTLLPSGLAFVAVENEVWLSDGDDRLEHFATLPESVQALATFGSGFVAIAASQVFVLEGAGPIRRVLTRNPASPYQTTEPALAVAGRQVLISTLCLSWSSYPGYDTAVLDLDAGSARWWWQVYPSQFEVPAFPVARANVGSNTWSSVELRRSARGFVTTQLP